LFHGSKLLWLIKQHDFYAISTVLEALQSQACSVEIENLQVLNDAKDEFLSP
jgi:hypothetical protein